MADPSFTADTSGDGDDRLVALTHPRGTFEAVRADVEKHNPDPFGEGRDGLDAPPDFRRLEDSDDDDVELEKAVERRVAVEAVLAKYDTSSLESKPGKSDNWIEAVGGELPSYVRAVAHALERGGHSRSQAIQIAIGTLKRWAAGGGDVSAETRSKAAKAVAEWEALKAKAAAK